MNLIQKRKFSILNSQLLILLLLAAMLFAGCTTDTPEVIPDEPDNPDTPVNVVMQNVALTGLVKDAGGNPLSGVKVTTGSLNATTGGDGAFTFAQAGTVDDRAVVKFEKSGYFPLTRSGDKQDEMYVEAMLYRKGNDSISLQTDFDAAKGKRLQFKDVTIDFPANCMAKADGSAYSGTVRVDVLYLNTANERAGQLMPGGDLLCIAADKSKKMLLTKGMMNVVLTDNNGNPLKIKAKTDIPISFPAPSGVTAAIVPLRTFDEARGIWKEEGSVTKQGNVYSGTVSHFTFYDFTPGSMYDWSYRNIHAETVCGEPAAGAYVTGYFTPGVKYDVQYFLPQTAYTTNAEGNCRILMPIEDEDELDGLYAYLRAFYADQMETAIVELNTPDKPVNFTFNVECVTLKINVTVCDKPKSGVQVQVKSGVSTTAVDYYPMGNFKSMTTDAAGNCTTQVTKGSQVHVIVTYNGKTQETTSQINESTADYFSFDDGCDDRIPEVFAYKYTYTGVENGINVSGTEYRSWDNYGKRWRSEGEEKQGSDVFVNIDIYDHLTHLYYSFENEGGNPNWLEAAKNPNNWSSVTFEENSKWNSSLLLPYGRFTISAGYQPAPSNQYVEYSVIGGYTKRSSTETVLGKVCNIWDNTSTGSVIWEWKKVIFRETVNGQVTYQLSKITEDVPVSAFTNQTVVPIWIE